jgi:tRNA nucleotidyltransferase/poly(A) polymerase
MLNHYYPILNAIKDLDSTAHIGGGAVRDTLLERPIRDVDLFLEADATDGEACVLRSRFGYGSTRGERPTITIAIPMRGNFAITDRSY